MTATRRNVIKGGLAVLATLLLSGFLPAMGLTRFRRRRNATVKLSGVLTRQDTGTGISNQTIGISYVLQGSTIPVNLPSVVTDINGAYSTTTNLMTGVYNFTANFAGIPNQIGPSMSTLTIKV